MLRWNISRLRWKLLKASRLTLSRVTLEGLFIRPRQNLFDAELGGKSCETTQFCHYIPDLYWKFVRLLWMFSGITMGKSKIPTLRWNSQLSCLAKSFGGIQNELEM